MYDDHEEHEDTEGYPQGTAFSRYETAPTHKASKSTLKVKLSKQRLKSFVTQAINSWLTAVLLSKNDGKSDVLSIFLAFAPKNTLQPK